MLGTPNTAESGDASNRKRIKRPRPFLNCAGEQIVPTIPKILWPFKLTIAECRRLKIRCDRQGVLFPLLYHMQNSQPQSAMRQLREKRVP